MHRFYLFLGSLFTATVVQVAAVSAAPQILAVMSAFGDHEMQCSGSACTTTLTSYCLQRERDVPTTGQAYLPAHPDHFSLVIVDKDGNETKIAAEDRIEFRAKGGYTMVTAVVGHEVLEQFNGVDARIVAARGAALVPVPEENDPNPITDAEIAFATSSLRDLGQEMVDANPSGQAAELINRVAATIVPSMPASDQGLNQLWHDVIDNLGPATPAGQDAIKRAREIYNWCQGRMSYHSMSGVKSCLEFKHDNEIMRLNTDYWESQPGY